MSNKTASTLPTLINQSKNFMAVVGPTATGKSSFVLDYLAPHILSRKKFNQVSVISADSRQVYKDISIISGADIPEDFEFVSVKNKSLSYYQNRPKNVQIFGVNILDANQEWSVADFRRMVEEIVESSKDQTMHVIVGGTGLYYRYLFQDSPEMVSKPIKAIRKKAKGMSLSELQDWLVKLSPKTYIELNNSDKNNPRRLIRKIEQLTHPEIESLDDKLWQSKIAMPTLGLTASNEYIKSQIKKRVRSRWQNGAKEQIKDLLDNKMINFDELQLATATGVVEIASHLKGYTKEDTMLENWVIREFRYAKRQHTWFKKEPWISWVSVENPDWENKAISILSN